MHKGRMGHNASTVEIGLQVRTFLAKLRKTTDANLQNMPSVELCSQSLFI